MPKLFTLQPCMAMDFYGIHHVRILHANCTMMSPSAPVISY